MKKITPVLVGDLKLGSGMPKICVPITGKNEMEILWQAEELLKVHPDLVEWRADFFSQVMDEKAVEKVLIALSDKVGQIPLLFTFRSQKEGGNREISTEDYVNLNRTVSYLPQVQIIDVEVMAHPAVMNGLIASIHDQGKVVIGSHHRFDRTPARSDMINVLKTLELAGADIVKLAVMPHSQGDVKNLLQTTNEATCDYLNRPAITMSMGELGAVSRVVGEVIGSCVTFGCVGSSSAPGQIPVETLRTQLIDLHNIVEKISN